MGPGFLHTHCYGKPLSNVKGVLRLGRCAGFGINLSLCSPFVSSSMRKMHARMA